MWTALVPHIKIFFSITLGTAQEMTISGPRQDILVRLQEEQLEALLIQMTKTMNDITSDRNGTSMCSRCGQYLLGRCSRIMSNEG
jgi:hypothetical protein